MNLCTICGNNHIPFFNCQAWRGIKKSEAILSNHKKEKFCKKWQNCSKCSFIKYKVKILKHLSGGCRYNTYITKCPVCYEKIENPLADKYYVTNRVRIVMWLYKEYLS